jgi:serine/threonine protein kinase
LSEFREAETRYRVQLRGFDAAPSEWTAEARKEYTNLEAGEYAFLVWGRDWAGNESGPVEVRFRVTPAPWRTGWAYALYVVMFGGALYGGAWVRVRALERRNRLLEARIAERTAELARKNEEISEAKDEVERKNVALDDKIKELARKNEELITSQRRADRIFSALAEALPGTVLDGKYRLDAKIGAGGYGAVFRGMHLTLNRPIAIKVFRPQGGNDSPEALERFRLEGVSACRIAHPNAVAVLDSGISTEGVAYLVMELLTGYSLAQELRAHHQLSLRRCVEIIVPVCLALAEAHRIGVIHRDIKPENVFLHYGAEGETVKVVDFGIAKFLGAESGEDDLRLTATEGIVGTPAYIAPERVSQKAYDGRSDVYSVGVTLYQMLAGALPFDSDSGVWGAILKSLTQPPPPLHGRRPEIPPEIERIVMRTLEKDPARRPTASELAEDLTKAAARFAPLPARETALISETRRVHAVKITDEENRRTAEAPTLASASEADGGETIDATRLVVPDSDDGQPTRRG